MNWKFWKKKTKETTKEFDVPKYEEFLLPTLDDIKKAYRNTPEFPREEYQNLLNSIKYYAKEGQSKVWVDPVYRGFTHPRHREILISRLRDDGFTVNLRNSDDFTVSGWAD